MMPEQAITPKDAGDAPPAADHAATILTVVAIGAGVLLRTRQYVSGRSLWLDEAMLANNVLARSFADLAGRLDADQAAPIGFLWLVKLATAGLGTSEMALRLVPFVAGLLTLPAMWWMTRRLTRSAWAAALATTFLAASLEPVFYASELKHYGLDLFAAIVLPVLALRVLDEHDAARRYRAFVLLAVAGLAMLLTSFAALFVAGGVGVTLGLVLSARRDWRGAGVAAGIGAAWLACFGLVWHLSASGAAQSEFLNDFWRDTFLPLPTSGEAVRVWIDLLYGMLAHGFAGPPRVLGDRMTGALLVAVIAGACWLAAKRRWVELAMLWLPVALAAGASMLQKYPFADRLILFTAAATLTTAAAGLGEVMSALWRGPQREHRLAARCLLVGLLAVPAVCVLVLTGQPLKRQEMRPVLTAMRPLVEEGDFVYRHRLAEAMWTYYAPRLGLDQLSGASGDWLRDADGQLRDRELRRLPESGRVWIVSGQPDLHEGAPDLPAFFAELDRRGAVLLERRADGGVEARLYRFAPSTPTTQPASRPAGP